MRVGIYRSSLSLLSDIRALSRCGSVSVLAVGVATVWKSSDKLRGVGCVLLFGESFKCVCLSVCLSVSVCLFAVGK